MGGSQLAKRIRVQWIERRFPYRRHSWTSFAPAYVTPLGVDTSADSRDDFE